jgi:hypothetical protein
MDFVAPFAPFAGAKVGTRIVRAVNTAAEPDNDIFARPVNG